MNLFRAQEEPISNFDWLPNVRSQVITNTPPKFIANRRRIIVKKILSHFFTSPGLTSVGNQYFHFGCSLYSRPCSAKGLNLTSGLRFSQTSLMLCKDILLLLFLYYFVEDYILCYMCVLTLLC